MVKKGVQVGLYLSGQPVPVPECNIYIAQPKIKDIVLFGEDEFLIGSNLLGHTDRIVNKVREGNPLLESLDDFQLLMMMLKEEPTVRDTIINFLEFICPDYEIKVEENIISFAIIVNDKKQNVGQLFPFNFHAFQDVLNDIFDMKAPNNDEPDYNPVNEAAAAIAKKIQQGRDRKNRLKENKEGPQSIFGRYISILSIGLAIDMNILFNYTIFQLCDSFNRYFLKVSSDLYTKVSTTPLMDVSKMKEPDDWTGNIYK